MPILSIAVTLLVILSALYFLAKVKAENLGSLFKYSTYLVLVVAAGLLLFQLARGGSKVWHRKMCSGTECNAPGHYGQKPGKMMGRGGGSETCCCSMMDCSDQCSSGAMADCCRNEHGKMGKRMHGGPDVVRESSVDTVDGKIIMKETEIIKRTE